MESKLQHADGGLGRSVHGGSDCRRIHCKLLPKHKILSYRFMGSKMIKLIMLMELAFFFWAGTVMFSPQAECEKYVSMTLYELTNVKI